MSQNHIPLVLIAGLCLFAIPSWSHENHQNNAFEEEMVWIPPGEFIFGTDQKDSEGQAISFGIPKPWYADENPSQKVFLKGFYLDRFEVTNRRYKIYLDAVGAFPPSYWENNTYSEGLENHPVVWVTWYDAANFCSWAGTRLPTEKEWERAAKGKKNLDYPWGQDFNIKLANLAERAGSKNPVGPVGSYPKGASSEGIQDLIGNVWEWIEDDYAPYKGSAYASKQFNNNSKIIRGASASYLGHFPDAAYRLVLKKIARNGFRQPAQPDQAAKDVGFRCATETKPKGRLGALNQLAGKIPKITSEQLFQVQSTKVISDTMGLSERPPVFNPFEAKPNLPQSGILILIFLSFFAGLLSFLSPCTLPILPAYFAVTAQADHARVTFMSFAFFCGLAFLFVLMGASASFLGQILRDYILSLTTLGGIAVSIFGIMTLFGKGFSGGTFRTQPTSTFIGSFFFGATFALGWTPCVGPILSGILILAASDKTVLQGMSLLFFYAIGLGLPLILIAAFFSHLKKESLFWRLLRGKGWDLKIAGHNFLLHTTNLFSGILLIVLGLALALDYMTYLNNAVPINIQVWFSEFEEKLLNSFM